jgi:hypothetical protein
VPDTASWDGRFGYWLDGLLLRAVATDMTTVEIELDLD